jgi:hypothetical protein
MLECAIGHSDDVDSADALADALAQCERKLAGAEPHAALLLAGYTYDHALLLARLRARYPQLPIIGGTTDGEMSGVREYTEQSVLLVLLRSDELEFRVGVGHRLAADPLAATAAAVTMAAIADRKPALCITVPDGLTTSGDLIVEGLQARLGEGVPIVGGLAGDMRKFVKTLQFFGDEVVHDTVTVLLVYGPLQVTHGIGSGWEPVGKTAKVTRAEGHVVHEVDGRPVLDLYRHYLGPHLRTESLHEYPLAVFEPGMTGYYIRAPFGLDEAKGTVTFSGRVAQGADVQMTQAHRANILAGTASSIRDSLAAHEQAPDVVLVFCCASRNEMLGTRTVHEIRTIIAALPEGTAVCGFYAYGEICPVARGGVTRFHNETCVTVALSCAAPARASE